MTDSSHRLELWKDVAGYEGRYLISSHGRLARLMLLSPHRDGYSKVSLSQNGRRETLNVHQLVAGAFLGRRARRWQINHRDGNKQNNALANLEYVTPSQNALHASALGLRASGAAVNTAKLTEADVASIRRLYARGDHGYSTLARRYGVNKSTIANIVKQRTWKETPPPALQLGFDIPLDEAWLPVPRWEPYYLVSNLGRVARISQARPSPDGYVRVALSGDVGRQYISVHRLVAQAFLPGYGDEIQVNHIDGDKANNHVDNLECLPVKEHYYRTVARLGYHPAAAGPRGSLHSQSRLTEEAVRRIRELYAAGTHSLDRLGASHGVTKQAVWHIVHRKTWRHI